MPNKAANFLHFTGKKKKNKSTSRKGKAKKKHTHQNKYEQKGRR